MEWKMYLFTIQYFFPKNNMLKDAEVTVFQIDTIVNKMRFR